MTLNLKVNGKTHPVQTYLDTCSQRSLINKRLIEKLQIPLQKEKKMLHSP